MATLKFSMTDIPFFASCQVLTKNDSHSTKIILPSTKILLPGHNFARFLVSTSPLTLTNPSSTINLA